MPYTWNENDLYELVPLCTSVDMVVRELGLKPAGGNQVTVKHYIEKLGIDTSHFLGQGHRKGSNVAVIERQSLDSILVQKSSYTNSHRLKLRLISENLKEHRCELCNNTVWLNNKIPLELHHKNGIRNDHRLENLELLCPNCHALSDNYRAKNIKV